MRTHCDTCQWPGTVTLNQCRRRLEVSLTGLWCQSQRSPQLSCLVGFGTPQGSTWAATGKRKQK